MYAIIQLGSQQFKVEEGDTIEAYRLEDEKKKNVKVDEVLLYAKGQDIRIGQPYLKDVKVTARVIGDTKGEKVVAFKYQIRKSTSRKIGHRQKLTAFQIEKIEAA